MRLRSSLPALLVALTAPLAFAPAALAHNDVLAPDGGEVFQVGERVTIEWTVTIAHGLAGWDVLYSTNGTGGPFVPIALGLPPGDEAVGSYHAYDWTVPDLPTSDARILVRMNGSHGGVWESVSDGAFRIDAGLGARSCAGQSPNSTGVPATLHLTGSASAATNDLTLRVVDLPTGTVGYPINSDTLGFAATPGGSQGNLCLGGSIGRHVTQVGSSGTSGVVALPIDLANLPRLGGAFSASAGETWSFQFWYRDANPQTTSNFSDVVSVTLQ
ncbi:MAG: hypothetical protein AAF957_16880 [Planctomycetota bacterium]